MSERDEWTSAAPSEAGWTTELPSETGDYYRRWEDRVGIFWVRRNNLTDGKSDQFVATEFDDEMGSYDPVEDLGGEWMRIPRPAELAALRAGMEALERNRTTARYALARCGSMESARDLLEDIERTAQQALSVSYDAARGAR